MEPVQTPYGQVAIGERNVVVSATAEQLRDWARRPGASWPCSMLADIAIGNELVAAFDSNGLYDLYVIHADDPEDDGPCTCTEDLSNAELDAWSSDVLRDVIGPDHPAWFVTVGQFEEKR